MDQVTGVIQRILFSPIALGNFNLPFNLFSLILRFVLPVILCIIGYKLVLMGIAQLFKLTKLKESTREKILHWSRIVLRVVLGIFFISFITGLFGAEIGRYLGDFYGVLAFPLIANTRISMITLILMIPVFYLASAGAYWVQLFIEKTVFKPLDLPESRKFTLGNLIKYGVMAALILIGLQLIGIDLTALTVIFGALGIGIGFGLQSTFANFIAGLIIIFSRPIKEKDRISVNNIEGNVVQIKMLSSVISTLTHETIIVPNSQLVNSSVHNYSYDDRQIVLVNEVQVAYSSDLEKAQRVLQEALKESFLILAYPEPEVLITSFDASGITLTIRSWIADVTEKYEKKSEINLLIWKTLKSSGIEIPFPQMDVHMKKPGD